MARPRISIIIPVRSIDCRPQALDTLAATEGLGTVEILIVAGNAPARQRNSAVEMADADILYFIDDDSRVDPRTLCAMVERFESAGAAALGGPSVTRSDASFFEKCVGELMASRFGAAVTQARATGIGSFRRVDGEELVSSNLLMSRSWFLEVGGLDESLYPGEDVDLVKKLRSKKAPMFYDPEAAVEHQRCKSVAELVLQSFRYAHGRGLRLTKHFRSDDLLFLAPLLFLLNLCLFSLLPSHGLKLYTLLALTSGLEVGRRRKSLAMAALCTVLFPLTHAFYGLGMLVGLAGFPMNRPSASIDGVKRVVIES